MTALILRTEGRSDLPQVLYSRPIGPRLLHIRNMSKKIHVTDFAGLGGVRWLGRAVGGESAGWVSAGRRTARALFAAFQGARYLT